jgi:hypothetical protein
MASGRSRLAGLAALAAVTVFLCAQTASANLVFTAIGPYGGTSTGLVDNLSACWPSSVVLGTVDCSVKSPPVITEGTNPFLFNVPSTTASGHGCAINPADGLPLCGSPMSSLQIDGGAAARGIFVNGETRANGTGDSAQAGATLNGQIIWTDSFRMEQRGTPDPTGSGLLQYSVTPKVEGRANTSGLTTGVEVDATWNRINSNGMRARLRATGPISFEGGMSGDISFSPEPFIIEAPGDSIIQIEEVVHFQVTAAINVPGESSEQVAALDLGTDTVRYFVDPITPGATYETASGFDYRSTVANAVPEPASVLSFATGVAALATAFARRTAREQRQRRRR